METAAAVDWEETQCHTRPGAPTGADDVRR